MVLSPGLLQGLRQYWLLQRPAVYLFPSSKGHRGVKRPISDKVVWYAVQRALSANDCFCFVTALAHAGILLTGDSLLRRVAADNGLRVHGVLWVVDEPDASGTCARSLLTQALKVWQGDDTVFLPQHEISTRLEYLAEAVQGRVARTMNNATLRQPLDTDQCGH